MNQKLINAVTNYKMPQTAVDVLKEQDILLLCGVTAAGKNTLIHHLMLQSRYEFVVSHTTRKPRMNHGTIEENGVAYWFVDDEEMIALVSADSFIEVKAVHGDTVYGTSIKAVIKASSHGQTPIQEIDVQGALEYIEAVPGIRPLFILPPSFEVWMQRLEGRGGITEQDKSKRLTSALDELRIGIDHPDFLLVVNNEVEQTVEEINSDLVLSKANQSQYHVLAEELYKETFKLLNN